MAASLAKRNVFSQRVEAARLAAGLTQKELGVIAGISQQTITNIENGLVRSSRQLLDLAAALNVSPEWLIGKSNSRKNAEASLGGAQVILPAIKIGELVDALILDRLDVRLREIGESKSFDPQLFVGLPTVPEFLLHLSAAEYIQAVEQTYDGGGCPPKTAVYLGCVKPDKTFRRFQDLPKISFDTEIWTFTLLKPRHDGPAGSVDIPYMLTVLI